MARKSKKPRSPPPVYVTGGEDIKAATHLLKEDFMEKHRDWRNELEMMVNMEFEALSVFDLEYLINTFMPCKLQREDYTFYLSKICATYYVKCQL
nr:DNA topoisomerase 6 subunit A [Tanacetum cinerariifolium]